MNIYIVNKIEELDVSEDNYELDDEVLTMLFKNKNYFPDKLAFIFNIDPYEDCFVNGEDLYILRTEFSDIIEVNSKTNFLDHEQMLLIKEILILIDEAIKGNKMIAFIGD